MFGSTPDKPRIRPANWRCMNPLTLCTLSAQRSRRMPKGRWEAPPPSSFFRRHPEWTGAPYNSVWSVLDIKQFDAKSPFDTGDNHWPRAMSDFGSWPIAYAHIKQLRLAANEFRFDAVRYDDHLQVGWVNGGYNPMTARNMEQITSRLRRAIPYFWLRVQLDY